MAPTRGARQLIAVVAFSGLVTQAAAQTQTSAPTSTITSASSLGSASTSTDVPLALWSEAASLLSSYYPSTTLTQVASLTWPSAVVIGSSTYSVPPKSTSSAATSVLAESTGVSQPSHGLRSDEKLGIGIGVAVGAVAVIVLGIVFCLMHRRRKASGAFFKRRPTPSVTDSDVEAWRSPMSRQASTLSYGGPSREWMSKYNRMSDSPAENHLQPPPMAMHPALVRQHSSRSTSEENPFFTPNESPDNYETTYAGAAGSHREMNDTPSQQSSHSTREDAPRAVTPFSPAMMMSTSWAQRMHGQNVPQEHQPQHNPFASPEDDETDDILSPIIPARSPERRHSPMVHYPSWSEVSEFDFAGDGRGPGRVSRASLRGQSSNEDGGDGWRPSRGDSVYGRHELA